MRILHTADIHLGELTGPVIDNRNARMMDTIRCMDHVVIQAQNEHPDAILIAGDLFNKAKLWGEEMLEEIGIAVSWLRRLAAIAPTVLMFGTETHENLKAFENIQNHNINGLHIVTKPQCLTLMTQSGPLQVAAVPGYDKGYFRSMFPGMDPTEENAKCSQMLGEIILGLGAQIDPLIPSVLMSHYTVVGCQLENGEHIFLQSDVVLPREALSASPFNLVCLGHIHRAHEVENCGVPVFYSGPINAITFNEEGQDKGFWIHEIGTIETDEYSEVPTYHESQFFKTPSREFHTLYWTEQDVEGFVQGCTLADWVVKDKIVRVKYTCSEETNKQFNRKALEKALYDAGAFYVAEITPERITTVLQKQEMSENDGPMENLAAWARLEGLPGKQVNELVELARPLIETVSAKMPTGKLTGMFVPKRIEVKNYRSYVEESFDFAQINFATINGPNGVGKSALFMDAICDCLYEEPREGDLTGWISNDESVRSGSIMFEFSMGETNWRVTRTRTKGGKSSLALDEMVDGKWESRSCAKARETQEKIISLLGMDAMTFRCCGLIMQDAYGLFMEAPKEDRMQVLANILGLNLYEQLMELSKSKVTDVNRELTRSKDKLSELDEKLKARPGLENDLKDVESELTVVAHDIAEKEAALKDAEEVVRQLSVKNEKAEELQKQIISLVDEIQGKEQEKTKCQDQIKWADDRLTREDTILAKAAEYEQVKEQLTVLKTKQPQLEQLKSEYLQITDDAHKTGLNIKRLAEQITAAESLLSKREELQQAADEYRKISLELESLDALAEQWRTLDNQLKDNKSAYDAAVTKYENQKSQIRKEIDLCREQSEVLSTLQCSEYDTCPLVAQAVLARDIIPVLEEKLSTLDKTHMEKLETDGIALQEERNSLQYDQNGHVALKSLASQLKPKAEQAAELNAKAEVLKNLEEQREQALEQERNLIDKQAELNDKIKSLTEELKPLAELEIRLPKLAAWLKAKDELPVAKQIKESATERIAAIDQEILVKDSERKQLADERADMLIAASGLQVHKDDVDILTRQIKALQEKQNQLYVKAGGLKAKLEALQRDQEERNRLAANMEPTAKLLVQYQTLSKAFGFDGIPFAIVRSVVPELSALANEILAQMTGGKMSLEMRTERLQKSNKKEVNALEIWITDYRRGTLPYKSHSGGQRVKSALSVAFALADLKARRAGIQLGMLFIDEPPFLDAEGIEAYCDALELVSLRYPNMIVLAISHDPRMKARFPQKIDVIDTEAGSKVKLVA